MSVLVDRLTKVYGNQRAVDEISFEAPKGRITGFLGPNGAGKSTTMKIATGFILPSSGDVRVDGLSVCEKIDDVKKITGYLPEHNPLYLDMYVREFLRFIASVYRVKYRKRRVEEMIDTIGLKREANKRIGALSKGYRQRVGLAQALVHSPSVLILDEPTTGLDPNQIVEIRSIIKDLSAEKTVILSTHIMQEVEALCDKVVIIDRGHIVADDTVDNLKKNTSSRDEFLLTFEKEVDASVFAELKVEKQDAKTWVVEASEEITRDRLLQFVAQHELPLEGINRRKTASLEEVFRQLTESKDG